MDTKVTAVPGSLSALAVLELTSDRSAVVHCMHVCMYRDYAECYKGYNTTHVLMQACAHRRTHTHTCGHICTHARACTHTHTCGHIQYVYTHSHVGMNAKS